ncbi:MAG: exo-alpha-sialidase [Nitrospira sp.]|nr:MAG: exo-alpha-sialidase [Nitrospira sp.]
MRERHKASESGTENASRFTNDASLTGDASRFTTLETSVVYKGYQDEALFPGLTRAANGDILVSFCTQFDCQPGGEAFLLRSLDEGRTWEPPVALVRSKKSDGCINLSVGLNTLKDGTVLYPCCDTKITRKWDRHEADLIILRSLDHGATWSDPVPIPTGVIEPFAYGRIIELRNGDLLCPIWGKGRSDEAWRTGLVRSRDGGLTWGEHITIGYDPHTRIPTPQNDVTHCAGFNEATLVELPNERILAVLRQQGVGPNIRQMFQSQSLDGGLTWSEPQPVALWGTSPSLHLTASGLLLLGYRNHMGNPQGLEAAGVGISLSEDFGATWTEHRLLEDPQGYRYQHEFEAGYPAFFDLDGHRTLVVFYSFDPASAPHRYLGANVLSLA